MEQSLIPEDQSVRPGAVVSRIWEIYKQQAGVLIGLAVLVFFVQFILALVIPGVLGLILALLFWVLSTLYQGMVVQLVRDIQDGRLDSSIGQLASSISPVLVPLMVASFLLAIGVGIGFVLLIIPGLFLLTIWSVVAPVIVLERPGIIAAFGRSRELVRGHGWDVFGVIVIVYVTVLVISLVAGIAADGLGAVGRALIQWAVNVVLAPVTALSAAVLYLRLRRAHGEAPLAAGVATEEPPRTEPPPAGGPPVV